MVMAAFIALVTVPVGMVVDYVSMGMVMFVDYVSIDRVS